MTWRMTAPCDECPFNRTGEGRTLRRGLGLTRAGEASWPRYGLGHTLHVTSEQQGQETAPT